MSSKIIPSINYLTTNQVAVQLGVSSATVRNWHKSGLLNAVKQGRGYIYSKVSVQTLLKQLRNGDESKLLRGANKNSSKTVRKHKELASSKIIKQIQVIILDAKLQAISCTELLSCCGFLILHAAHKPRLAARFSISEKLTDQLYKQISSLIVQYNGHDLIGLIYQHIATDGKKSRQGSVYTPFSIAKSQVLGKLSQGDYFLDPCCGSGVYLLAAIDELKTLKVKNWWQYIYGADLDPCAILCSKINCYLQLEDDVLVNLNITCCDSLLEYQTDKKFSLIATNPPWGAHFTAAIKDKLKQKYSAIESGESCSYFLEFALTMLTPNGYISLLLPETVCFTKKHIDLRKLCLKNNLFKFKYLGNLFKGLMTKVVQLDLKQDLTIRQIDIDNGNEKFMVDKNEWLEDSSLTFNYSLEPKDKEKLLKIESHKNLFLGDKTRWGLGIVTGNNGKLVKTKRTLDANKIYKGQDVGPYNLKPATHYIDFIPDNFQQCAPKDIYFSPEKLIYRFIGKKLCVAYDNQQSLTLNSANILIPDIDIFYMVAVLNSAYANFYFQKKFNSLKVLRSHLEQLPVADLAQVEKDKVVNLVKKIIALDGKSKNKALSLHREIDIILNNHYEIEL